MELPNFGISFETMPVLLGLTLVVVLILFISIHLFLARRDSRRLIKELQQQTDLLNKMTDSLDELDDWMRYFNDKFLKSPKGPPPEKRPPQRDFPDESPKYKKTP